MAVPAELIAQLAAAPPAAQATLAALAVGVAHGGAHYLFGDPVYFSKSAVNKAGLTVVVATWIVVFVARGGLAGVIG